ncbi:MAG: 4-hydroxy-3-methylbut-2-enyl diphosphate reductase [Planctomycetes bacterium]|nr:4-hydroxy-3-methylbut-2-enyl diphosphate reductase [Planctomycetota bacterium]
MEIKIAREIGYCYGVRDAVDMAIEESERARGGKVFTLGPIIHNPDTIEMLENRYSVHAVDAVDQIDRPGATVVIRTHGTTAEKAKGLSDAGFDVKDATCPFVLKTQRKAREFAAEGYHIVILGHKKHPELIGIAGHVPPDQVTIVDTREDLANLKRQLKIVVLFQSTVTYDDYAWAIAGIGAKCYEMRVLQTVCGVTITRQKRVDEVAREVELMIVIGGKNSSNTKKLVDVSRKYARTVHIEDPEEIEAIDFAGVKSVGIGTGTSTPDFLVDRVVGRLKAKAGLPAGAPAKAGEATATSPPSR